MPGLLSRIIVCLLLLLCILETFNLCKHLGNLLLQPLQKKSQEEKAVEKQQTL